MKSFYISKVLLVLYVVELEAVTSVSQFPCRQRNLSVTVYAHLEQLYIDGIKLACLPNADKWNKPDVVNLPCTARLVAMHVRSEHGWSRGGILASTDDEFLLTNGTWKCSSVRHNGWEGIDFDDSAWVSAIEYGRNGENGWTVFMHGIRVVAHWIWLRQDLDRSKIIDAEVYCRKRLDRSTGNISTCSMVMGVFFGVSILANIALISALCVLHLRKKPVEDEGQSGAKDLTCQYHANIVRDTDQNAVDCYDDLRY